MAETVEAEFSEIGYKPEHRPFHPHITIGRVRSPKHAFGLDHALQAGATESYGYFEVCQLVVFMSELKSGGAVYTPMQRVKLLDA